MNGLLKMNCFCITVGYVFKPVSVWYLMSFDHEMVCDDILSYYILLLRQNTVSV